MLNSSLSKLTTPDTGAQTSAPNVGLLGLDSAVSFPTSPSNFNIPVFRLSADASIFYVKIFSTSDCSGVPIIEGTADSLKSPGWKIDVASGANDLYVLPIEYTGRKFACTKFASYNNDISLAPYAPTGFMTDQFSNTSGWTVAPRLLGVARKYSTVRVYASANCTGNSIASGSADAFSWPGLQVPSQRVATSQVYTVTDELAGSVSNCSATLNYQMVPRFRVVPANLPTNTTIEGFIVFRVKVAGTHILAASTNDWGRANSINISSDSGSTFYVANTTRDGIPTYGASGIAYDAGKNAIYTGDGYGTATVSKDLGLTWASFAQNIAGYNYTGDIYADDKKLYYCGANGIIYSEDGGKTFVLWNSSRGLPTARCYAIVVQENNVYAATAAGFAISHNNGQSFIVRTNANSGLAQDNLSSGYGSSKFAVDGSDIYVPTAVGLSISHDGGTTFTTKTTAQGLLANNLSAVAVLGSKVYAVSHNNTPGCLSISNDGGSSFTAVSNAVLDCPGAWDQGGYDVSVDPDSGLLAVATTTGLRISTNGGTSFINKTGSTVIPPGGIGGIAITSNDYIYVGHTNGNIYKTTDGGLNFAAKAVGNALVDVAAQGVYVYGGTSSGGVGVSSDSGETFALKTTAQGLGSNSIKGVFVGSDGKVYASTTNGLSISSDHGASFVNHTAGLGSTYVYQSYVDGTGKIYAATSGGLSISTNGGTSFTNITTDSSLGSNNIYSVYVDSDGTLYVGASNALKISHDGGATFEVRGLSTNSFTPGISHIYKGSDGLLYFALGFGAWGSNGLSYSGDEGASIFSRSTGVKISGFAKDSHGNVFIAWSIDGWGQTYVWRSE